MHPRHIVGHKFLQEERCGDCARECATAVCGVGNVAVEHVSIRRPKRHPPQRVGGSFRCTKQRVSELVIIAEHCRQIRTQSYPRRTSQRGKIDDQNWLVLNRLRQRVGQYQPSFGIGIVDLDGNPFAALQDIARPERVARDAVLRRRDKHMQPHRQMRGHDKLGKRQRVRRTAHILLHNPHAAGRFDIEPAAVKGNPLTHYCDAWMPWVTPFEFDQARRMFAHRRLADSMYQRITGLQRLAAGDGNFRLMGFGNTLRLGLQRIRPAIASRPVDQIADERGGSSLMRGVANATWFLDKQNPRAGNLRLAKIFVIAILPEHPAQHCVACIGIRQSVSTLWQAIRRLSEVPHSQRSRIRNACNYSPFPGFVAGQDGYIISPAFEFLRFYGGADGVGLRGKPRFKTVLVDYVDGGCRLAVVRLDQIVITHEGCDSGNRAETGDISEMPRIFLVLAVALSVFGLSACNRAPVNEVPLPEDVASVTTPFLAAVKRGDQAAAEKFMSETFVDDSRIQFTEMSALLKKSPPLVPAIYQPKAELLGPNENEVNLTFATKDGKQWISSEIRMYRPENGKFEIEYWDVNAADKPPELLAHAAQMRMFTGWFMGGMAVMALLGLALLIWVVKRRTHIIAPDPVFETRRVAATVRDTDI